jgi:hypothetical protein
MTVPAEQQATADAGLEGWQLYFLARHGVLGDVDPDVVTAAAYFFPADVVRAEWTAARAVLTPEQAVDRYLALNRDWGRERFAGFPGVERLGVLAQRIVDAADVVGLPLFAGWRALPVPTDPSERLAHLMQLLREHRGACHGVAVVALGLPPLHAVLVNQGGERNALDYGWQPPFPTMTDADRQLRERVEELTDDLVSGAYAELDREERAELLDLLAAAHDHAFPGGVVPNGSDA